jgi:hypothetical protein
MRNVFLAVFVFSFALLATHALADDPIVYPAKGQTAEKQQKDEIECHEWATKDTGVDPVALAEKSLAAPAASPAPQGRSGGFGLRAMLQAKRQLREQKPASTQDGAAVHSQLDRYDRAYKACLTGRGYTVN